MSLLKLELRSKDVPAKLALGATHITQMAKAEVIASYPIAKRSPADADVLAAQTALETASADADAAEVVWKEKNALRDTAEENWDVVFTARGANCESITPGNVAALTSTGFPLRAGAGGGGGGSSPAPVGAPQNLRASMGDLEGEVDLMWEPQKGAVSHLAFYREHLVAGNWIQATVTTKSKATVPGLTSGKTYAFRVQAVSKDGPGPFSDEAVKMAP